MENDRISKLEQTQAYILEEILRIKNKMAECQEKQVPIETPKNFYPSNNSISSMKSKLRNRTRNTIRTILNIDENKESSIENWTRFIESKLLERKTSKAILSRQVIAELEVVDEKEVSIVQATLDGYFEGITSFNTNRRRMKTLEKMAIKDKFYQNNLIFDLEADTAITPKDAQQLMKKLSNETPNVAVVEVEEKVKLTPVDNSYKKSGSEQNCLGTKAEAKRKSTLIAQLKLLKVSQLRQMAKHLPSVLLKTATKEQLVQILLEENIEEMENKAKEQSLEENEEKPAKKPKKKQ